MRKIIITDLETSPGSFRVTAHLWLEVPVKRGFRGKQQSRLPDNGAQAPWGITAQEQALFAKGALQEQVTTAGPFANGTTEEAVHAALLVAHAAAQAQLDATAESTLSLVGTSFDGATWEAASASARP
jgi:hypothetical protein